MVVGAYHDKGFRKTILCQGVEVVRCHGTRVHEPGVRGHASLDDPLSMKVELGDLPLSGPEEAAIAAFMESLTDK